MITDPDIEANLLGYLNPLLGVTGSTRRPNTLPSSFYVVSVTDAEGIEDHAISTVYIAIELWAPTSPVASLLARRAKGYLKELEGTGLNDTFVYRVIVGGPTNFPDPATRIPRYLLTASLSVRAIQI